MQQHGIQNNSQKRIMGTLTFDLCEFLLLPVPRIHSTLSGALEGCDLCGQTPLSSQTTTPVAAPVKLRAILTAASPKKKNKE